MIAKLIVKGKNREEAIARMKRALKEFKIEGVDTTIPFHLKVLVNEEDELLLKGLEIDYVQDEFGSEFTLHNPNMIEMYDEEDGGCCGGGCCCR